MKRIIILAGVLILLLAVLAMVVLPALPMGTGSTRYARKWSKRLSRIKHPGDTWASLANVGELTLTNGEWIVWVSANSHSNPWGGTVVTKDSRGDTRAFYGHVCGWADLSGETLDDIYTSLLTDYGTNRADFKQKEAARSQELDRKIVERAALESRIGKHLGDAGIAVRRLSVDLDGRCSLDISRSSITDLTVLSALPLTDLDISATDIADLTPLGGMGLTQLRAEGCSSIADLAPLRGMPLEALAISDTLVSDLSPLAGMRLRSLDIRRTGVTDLSPLRGMPIRRILLDDCAIRDLTPLVGMPIESINWEARVRLDALRRKANDETDGPLPKEP